MMFGVPFKTRLVAIWLLLIAATVFSVLLFEHHDTTALDRDAGSGVIVIAFLKVRWVGLDFMELRHAPRGLRTAFEAWAIAMAVILLTIYWRSGATAL